MALLDGQVLSAQYSPQRILRNDVQDLLRKVNVRPLLEFSQRFPTEMPCRITITLANGQVFTKEKRDYEGFRTRPMQWDTAVKKFEQLTQTNCSGVHQKYIEEAITNLENIQITDFTKLLEAVDKQSGRI